MRERHGPVDIALLPIGAYAPRWFMADQHTDPDEAVRMMIDLEAHSAIGIHWGSLQLTDEARDEPERLLRRALSDRGIEGDRFPAALPGDSFDLTDRSGDGRLIRRAG
jgi:L-ascorbate metabolism protein UlaG (beta-lactamase superfamily)